MDITFSWISTHSDFEGNEKVDKMADDIANNKLIEPK